MSVIQEISEWLGAFIVIAGVLLLSAVAIAILYGGPVILVMAAVKWLFF